MWLALPRNCFCLYGYQITYIGSIYVVVYKPTTGVKMSLQDSVRIDLKTMN
jgi:hypothetical protein